MRSSLPSLYRGSPFALLVLLSSVLIAGDLAFVGAPDDWAEVPGDKRGAVYVFRRLAAGLWVQDARLSYVNFYTEAFGYSLASDGVDLFVGLH